MITCTYSAVGADHSTKKRKKSEIARNRLRKDNLDNEKPFPEQGYADDNGSPRKTPKVSQSDPPRSSEEASTQQGATLNVDSQYSSTSIDQLDAFQDDFTLPSDFLSGVFPESDLQSSEYLLADMNLDQYLLDSLSNPGVNQQYSIPSA